MKPKDIVVGQYYGNKNWGTGTDIWLGCGTRVMWEGHHTNDDSNFVNKHLIYVGEQIGYVGQCVQSAESENTIEGFWEGFYPIQCILKISS